MASINNWAALEVALEALAVVEAKIAKTQAKFEVTINDLKKELELKTKDQKAQAEELRKSITNFSMKNRTAFDEEPTKKFPFGSIAIKSNPEKITNLEGWTEAESVEKALELKGDYKDALVTSYKLNKDVLKTFTIKALEKIGLCLSQGETLTIKTKKVVLPD